MLTNAHTLSKTTTSTTRARSPRSRVVQTSASRRANRRGDRLCADESHIVFHDPKTERLVSVYVVSLPATRMGLVFRDVGAGPPVVESVLLNGYAHENTDIEEGDVLLRCSAYEIDVDHPNLAPKKFIFDATRPTPDGVLPNFATCMRALDSTALHSAGFLHRRVSCEFKRDIHDQREHDEHRWLLDTMARVGRLEADREMTEARTGASFSRSVGEHSDADADARQPLFMEEIYPVDD
jgi:hypothetical protein